MQKLVSLTSPPSNTAISVRFSTNPSPSNQKSRNSSRQVFPFSFVKLFTFVFSSSSSSFHCDSRDLVCILIILIRSFFVLFSSSSRSIFFFPLVRLENPHRRSFFSASLSILPRIF